MAMSVNDRCIGKDAPDHLNTQEIGRCLVGDKPLFGRIGLECRKILFANFLRCLGIDARQLIRNLATSDHINHRLGKVADFASGMHIGMGTKNTLGQGCSGSRHPDDKDRARAIFILRTDTFKNRR